jgi:hypothetical protein
MNRRAKKHSASSIAAGGVFSAIATLCLWFSTFVPVADLTASLFAGAAVYLASEHWGIRVGIPVFVVSGVIALLLVPDKTTVLTYLFLFGPYGFLKPLIEKIKFERKSWKDAVILYFMKIITAALLVFAGIVSFGELFVPQSVSGYAPPIVMLGALVVFLLYDRILTIIARVVGRHLPQ